MFPGLRKQYVCRSLQVLGFYDFDNSTTDVLFQDYINCSWNDGTEIVIPGREYSSQCTHH